MNEVTRILSAIAQGEPHSADVELVPPPSRSVAVDRN
jgi:hypothetical protein